MKNSQRPLRHESYGLSDRKEPVLEAAEGRPLQAARTAGSQRPQCRNKLRPWGMGEAGRGQTT